MVKCKQSLQHAGIAQVGGPSIRRKHRLIQLAMNICQPRRPLVVKTRSALALAFLSVNVRSFDSAVHDSARTPASASRQKNTKATSRAKIAAGTSTPASGSAMPCCTPCVPSYPPSSLLLWIGFRCHFRPAVSASGKVVLRRRQIRRLRASSARSASLDLRPLKKIGPLDQDRASPNTSATGSPFRVDGSDRAFNLNDRWEAGHPSDLAGVHARTHARFHRRGQQRLPNPLGQTQPGPTRTFLQQGELRLADFRAD